MKMKNVVAAFLIFMIILAIAFYAGVLFSCTREYVEPLGEKKLMVKKTVVMDSVYTGQRCGTTGKGVR
jgi:hypothetical protein